MYFCRVNQSKPSITEKNGAILATNTVHSGPLICKLSKMFGSVKLGFPKLSCGTFLLQTRVGMFHTDLDIAEVEDFCPVILISASTCFVESFREDSHWMTFFNMQGFRNLVDSTFKCLK